MRMIIKLFSLIMLFSFFSFQGVSASELESPIIIDGKYDDWVDKPSITDDKNDGVNPHEDLKEAKYITDDKYLYIYLERYPVEGEYKNSGLWDIWIPIINGNGNGAHNCFFPWDRVDGEVWYPQKVSTFKITTTFVEVWDSTVQDMVKEFRVRVSLNGASIGEDRIFRDSDGSKFEIRLPLELVGLSGNDEIQFSIGSDISAANEDIDWIYSDGPIFVTQGPIFGILTPFFVILAFIVVGRYIKR